LGRSLGVDLVPFKVCTYDCIYCQLGPTTRKTIQRKEYVPLNGVLDELQSIISQDLVFDYITLAGSGEPTLHTGIGSFIRKAKKMTVQPVAVITNGSLLWDADVRRDLIDADVVIPSLDAGSYALFQKVNRPHPAISFDSMVEGLIAFRSEFTNKIWLEILLVHNITDDNEEIKRLVDIVRNIRPDRVQLTTVTRPPTTGDAMPVPKNKLEEFARIFGDHAEVIAAVPKSDTGTYGQVTSEKIIELVRRHPCSIDDIAAGLSAPVEEVRQQVEKLLQQNTLKTRNMDGVVMFLAERSN